MHAARVFARARLRSPVRTVDLRELLGELMESGRLAEGMVQQQDLGHPGRYMMRSRI
ncbi:MAG TPA: hypothetical protein VN735_14620 [Steroidobacteraceae bacterium]|nr:hypothetical protein [Steroidobacteraceae bacterium]